MGNIPIYISAAALLFTFYQWIKSTSKADTTQITTVLIKLESIIESMTEVKADMRSMRTEMKDDMQDIKAEVQDLRERLAKAESSVASAHKRLDQAIGGRE